MRSRVRCGGVRVHARTRAGAGFAGREDARTHTRKCPGPFATRERVGGSAIGWRAGCLCVRVGCLCVRACFLRAVSVFGMACRARRPLDSTVLFDHRLTTV